MKAISRMLIGIFAASFLAGCSEVENFVPVSGVDYIKIATPVADLRIENYQDTLQETKNKVEVIEVFWYGCSSCYKFQSYVTELKDFYKDEIVYKKIPAPLKHFMDNPCTCFFWWLKT